MLYLNQLFQIEKNYIIIHYIITLLIKIEIENLETLFGTSSFYYVTIYLILNNETDVWILQILPDSTGNKKTINKF